MSDYTRPSRAPHELVCSDLPDWAVRVWLAVRGTQGSNDEAWADYSTYGERSGKSLDMVRKAMTVLKRDGWIEELRRDGNVRVLRCHVPGDREQHSRSDATRPGTGFSAAATGNERPGTGFAGDREQGSQSPTPPNKDESVQESVHGAREPVTQRLENPGPTLDEVLARARVAGVDAATAEQFFYHFDAQGWTTGGKNPRPIRVWQSKLMQWASNQKRYDRRDAPPDHPTGPVRDLTAEVL